MPNLISESTPNLDNQPKPVEQMEPTESTNSASSPIQPDNSSAALGSKLGLAIVFLILAILFASFIWPGYFFRLYSVTQIQRSSTSQTSPTTTQAQLDNQKAEILDILQNRYTGDIPNQTDLQRGELQGLVQSLGDKYTSYLSCQEYQNFQNDLNQTFEGIGARFELREETIVLTEIIDGYPAQAAGLLPNDILIAVDGVDTADLGFTKSIDAIRGAVDSTVKITIDRPVVSSPTQFTRQDYNIKRAKIQDPVLKITYQDDLAIIKVSSFSGQLDNLMSASVREIIARPKITKIILDLRDNGGGLLNQSVELVSYFIEPEQVVVREKSKTGTIDLKSISKSPNLAKYPAVVLVNKGTASAAEITAAALQDYNRAKLLGQKTFGKGVVQEIRSLSGCDKLKVTIAEWLTPKNREIDQKGVSPDITLKSGEDAIQKAKAII